MRPTIPRKPTSYSRKTPTCARTYVSRDYIERKGVKTGICPGDKRHFYAAKQFNMKDLHEIGDSFLANNDGFFVAKAFCGENTAPKYDSLFDSNINRTV